MKDLLKKVKSPSASSNGEMNGGNKEFDLFKQFRKPSGEKDIHQQLQVAQAEEERLKERLLKLFEGFEGGPQRFFEQLEADIRLKTNLLVLANDMEINQSLVKLFQEIVLAEPSQFDDYLKILDKQLTKLTLDDKRNCLKKLLDWGLDAIWGDVDWLHRMNFEAATREHLQALYESLETSADTSEMKLHKFREYAQGLNPELREFERLRLLQSKYLEIFRRWPSYEALTKALVSESEQSSFGNETPTHEATVGDGNCLFHAAFASRKNGYGEWEINTASSMRQAWSKFMKQFKGLADLRMPELVKVCVENVLMTLFTFPEKGGERFKNNPQVNQLRVETKRKLEIAQAISEQRSQEQREAYDVETNEEMILKQFLEDETVYKAYCEAIQAPNYYIFTEEIPIVAALSGTKIIVWRREQAGYYAFQEYNPLDNSRDKEVAELHQWVRKKDQVDQSIWGNIKEVDIYHAGQHYSRAKRGYLLERSQSVVQQNSLPKPDLLPSYSPTSNQIVDEIFERLLEQLKDGGIADASPSLFIIYAHDTSSVKYQDYPADGKIAQKLIEWLDDKLGLNLYSDKNPIGRSRVNKQITEQERRRQTDILYNQLCILPKNRLSVDYVILCGSKLLGHLNQGEIWRNYNIAINQTFTRSSLNDIDLLASELGTDLNQFEKIYDKDVHHILTELNFLHTRLRGLDDYQPTVIPVLLNGDRKSSLPGYVKNTDVRIGTMRFRDSGEWDNRHVFGNEGLYLGFFELLKRIFSVGNSDQRSMLPAIESTTNQFKDHVDSLRQGNISPETLKQIDEFVNQKKLTKVTNLKQNLKKLFSPESPSVFQSNKLPISTPGANNERQIFSGQFENQ